MLVYTLCAELRLELNLGYKQMCRTTFSRLEHTPSVLTLEKAEEKKQRLSNRPHMHKYMYTTRHDNGKWLTYLYDQKLSYFICIESFGNVVFHVN